MFVLVVTELLATLQLCSGKLLDICSVFLYYTLDWLPVLLCVVPALGPIRSVSIHFVYSVIPVHNGSFPQKEAEGLQVAVLRVK